MQLVLAQGSNLIAERWNNNFCKPNFM